MKHDFEGRTRLLSRNGGGDSNPTLFSAVDKFAIGKTAMINGSSMAISAMTPSESQQHNDAVDVHDIPITLVGGVE
jgi:hypothetical protein